MALFWNILRLFEIFLGRHEKISGLLEIHPSFDSKSDKKIYIFIYPSRLLD